jgi:hypothetical protein
VQDDSAISKWCAFDLFLSQDFARSWKNLTAESKGVLASFWDFEWGASLKRRRVRLEHAVKQPVLTCTVMVAKHAAQVP